MAIDMFRVCIMFIIIFSLKLWEPCNSQYSWKTRYYLRNKINNIARELVKDVEMKITSIELYKDMYHKAIPFQMGDMIYNIRHKFKRMVINYQELDKNIRYEPNSGNKSQFVNVMLINYQMAMEIDNLNLMLREYKRKRETKEDLHIRQKSVMRSGRVLGPDSWAGGSGGNNKNTARKKMNKKWRYDVDDDSE